MAFNRIIKRFGGKITNILLFSKMGYTSTSHWDNFYVIAKKNEEIIGAMKSL